jgi:hypothetical protein
MESTNSRNMEKDHYSLNYAEKSLESTLALISAN